jgi:hypothetical protein
VIDLTHAVRRRTWCRGRFCCSRRGAISRRGRCTWWWSTQVSGRRDGAGAALRGALLRRAGQRRACRRRCRTRRAATGAGQAYEASEVDVPPEVQGVRGRRRRSQGVSATFEGRDVFAPAAAFWPTAVTSRRAGKGGLRRMQALPRFAHLSCGAWCCTSTATGT